MDEFGGLRQAAKQSERARRRAERLASLLSSAFLGITALVFAAGLTLAAAAYGPRFGLNLPLHKMGLLGEIAASIAPTPDAAQAPGRGATGQLGQAPLELPSPIPTDTPSATATPTATDTPTPTPRFSATPTPTRTPTASPTRSPTPTATLSVTPGSPPPPSPTASAEPSPTEPSFPGCKPSANAGFQSALLELINGERAAQGLEALVQQGQLTAAARLHSTDMACNGLFSHTGSDGSSVGDRVTAAGYGWTSVGESIYATANTTDEAPQLALDWWMASPPNRANLLSETYTEVGVGYIYEADSPFGGYFTVVLARP